MLKGRARNEDLIECARTKGSCGARGAAHKFHWVCAVECGLKANNKTVPKTMPAIGKACCHMA